MIFTQSSLVMKGVAFKTLFLKKKVLEKAFVG